MYFIRIVFMKSELGVQMTTSKMMMKQHPKLTQEVQVLKNWCFTRPRCYSLDEPPQKGVR